MGFAAQILQYWYIWNDLFFSFQDILNSSSMKVVVNDQLMTSMQASPKALFFILHFLLYISDLLRVIFRSLLKIYVDDTTVCGCTSKTKMKPGV